VTEDAMHADGLATALFLTAPEKLARRFAFSAVRMHADCRVDVSGEFPGELFTTIS
jgi:FAD:protein FMN transferase